MIRDKKLPVFNADSFITMIETHKNSVIYLGVAEDVIKMGDNVMVKYENALMYYRVIGIEQYAIGGNNIKRGLAKKGEKTGILVEPATF